MYTLVFDQHPVLGVTLYFFRGLFLYLVVHQSMFRTQSFICNFVPFLFLTTFLKISQFYEEPSFLSSDAFFFKGWQLIQKKEVENAVSVVFPFLFLYFNKKKLNKPTILLALLLFFCLVVGEIMQFIGSQRHIPNPIVKDFFFSIMSTIMFSSHFSKNARHYIDLYAPVVMQQHCDISNIAMDKVAENQASGEENKKRRDVWAIHIGDGANRNWIVQRNRLQKLAETEQGSNYPLTKLYMMQNYKAKEGREAEERQSWRKDQNSMLREEVEIGNDHQILDKNKKEDEQNSISVPDIDNKIHISNGDENGNKKENSTKKKNTNNNIGDVTDIDKQIVKYRHRTSNIYGSESRSLSRVTSSRSFPRRLMRNNSKSSTLGRESNKRKWILNRNRILRQLAAERAKNSENSITEKDEFKDMEAGMSQNPQNIFSYESKSRSLSRMKSKSPTPRSRYNYSPSLSGNRTSSNSASGSQYNISAANKRNNNDNEYEETFLTPRRNQACRRSVVNIVEHLIYTNGNMRANRV